MHKVVMVVVMMVASWVWGDSYTLPQLPFAPSARSGHSMVALPDGRVMLYGGQSQTGQQYNDMYTYNGNGWTHIQAANVPPALTGHTTWLVGQRM